MKLFGFILLAISLAGGALAAATTYHVPLGPVDVYPDEFYTDSEGDVLNIKADVGVVVLKEEIQEALKEIQEVLKEEEMRELLGKEGRLILTKIKDPLKQKDFSIGIHREAGHMLLILKIEDHPLNQRALFRLKKEQLEKAVVEEETGLVLVDRKPVPLAKSKDTLTPDLLQRLRQQAESPDPRIRQRYVIVQEFDMLAPQDYLRWPGSWAFLASVVGLLAGAGLVRFATRKALVATGAHEVTEGPEAALLEVKRIVDSLRREVGSLSGMEKSTSLTPMEKEVRMQTIIDRLSEAQLTHMTAFIDARPQLIARLGLGGFAELMDSYAASERQINRAWSAAADGVYEETVECLDNAAELLGETIDRLKASGSL